MRVPDSLFTANLARAQARASATLYKASSVASSGLRVSAPADDPHAFARIASLKSGESRLDARANGLSRSETALTLGESTLAQASDVVSLARQLAVQMADGGVNAADRAAAAKQVTQLRQALVGLANTNGPDGYVFGGTKTDTPPFDATGAFVGNDNAVSVEIADGMNLRTNPSGARAFTAAGGRDILQDLQDFETALSTNDTTVIQSMTSALDAGHAQLVGARGEVGITLNRVQAAADVAREVKLQTQKARSTESEADALTAYANLSEAQQAFQRSIEISQQLLQTLAGRGR
jgi:flagellar hook-associated protein 3 FlgL